MNAFNDPQVLRDTAFLVVLMALTYLIGRRHGKDSVAPKRAANGRFVKR
jgi:hypothetical protein